MSRQEFPSASRAKQFAQKLARLKKRLRAVNVQVENSRIKLHRAQVALQETYDKQDDLCGQIAEIEVPE